MTKTSVADAVIEAVIDLINAMTPFATATRGALPTGSGIVCEIGPSTPAVTHMDKNTVVPLDVTINAKHPDLYTLTHTLNDIHYELTRAKSYPMGEGWQIVDIRTYTLPQIIGREGNNTWIMASALSVEYYER